MKCQYRGLTKEGKWVYGWYSHVREHKYYIGVDKHSIAPERHFIIQEDSEYMLDRTEPDYVYDISEAIEVIPETVGQQVGLKDKNGKEIYHHDIVKDKNGYKWEIMWGNAQFYLLSIEKNLLPDKYKFPGYCEIIGNIHQNPKLMEKK